MVTPYATAQPRPKARPFLPATPAAPVRLITSATSKAILIGSLALAYVLQFGLGVLTAVAIFVIRQDGELEEQAVSSAGYLLTVTIFGLVPVLLSLTVVLVYRARAGWTWGELGIARLPRGGYERRLWWRSAMVYLAALWVSGVVMIALSSLRGSGGYPTPEGGDAGRVLAILPESLMAGIGEELLLVAFLVVAMERLGARAPLIYVVAVTLRIAFHVYYGPAVIGLVLWAVAAVWIFRRTRLVVPLMIVHTLWDVNALSSEFVPVIAGLVMLVSIGCIVVTAIVHLATRRKPDRWAGAARPAHQYAAVPGGPPPAGWYPDPGDPLGWRYWDGAAWTPYAQRT